MKYETHHNDDRVSRRDTDTASNILWIVLAIIGVIVVLALLGMGNIFSDMNLFRSDENPTVGTRNERTTDMNAAAPDNTGPTITNRDNNAIPGNSGVGSNNDTVNRPATTPAP